MNEMKFSVLLSVYYKENPSFLEQALKSVFNQTISPSEVVLVQDGLLKDELNSVIEKFKGKYKKNFKVIKFKKNRGLGNALHDGLLECSNEIVFRMDTDDICRKDRFEKQLEIFKKMDVDVVGGNIIEFDERMKSEIGKRIVPESDKEIKKKMKKRNSINHVSVAYKKSKVLEAGNYLDMLYFEDYYLWARMIKNNCKFYNIQENLVNVRAGNNMIKRRGGIRYIKYTISFEKKLLYLDFINYFEYIKNIVERTLVTLMPINIRFLIYKKILRK